MSINFQAFLKLDTSKYLDQYIVMIDKKVVTNGKDIVSMLKSVQKKYPHKTPFIAKIPELISSAFLKQLEKYRLCL